MIHDIIKNRISIRAFSEKPVEEEKLKALFAAAQWAPSSRNEQPWRFILARKEDAETFRKMVEVLNERNKTWAVNAPVLILAISKVSAVPEGKINFSGLYDLGLSVENLSLQATAMNLYTHQMAGFDKQKAREFFDIPENFIPVVIIAAGYQGDVSNLPENFRKYENQDRKRRSLNETVFEGQYGLTSSLFEDCVVSD